MSEPLYAVYGASGCGRGIMPLAREQARLQAVPMNRLVFIDDEPAAEMVNDHRVMTYRDFLAVPASERHVAFALANSAIREKLVRRAEADGLLAWSITAANVVILDDVRIGEGAILCPFTMMTSNIRVGRHFHANIYSYVEHDCVIGDFVTFAPGVKCNGNIIIEDHAYLGSGAVIKQGWPGCPLVIGRGAVVGMGAVVTKDVAAGMTVVGNPARPISKG